MSDSTDKATVANVRHKMDELNLLIQVAVVSGITLEVGITDKPPQQIFLRRAERVTSL